tara:strand:+ start:4670 stop:8122 length:3453 start_codon:yes stop_codon:yes gene_type:complete
MYETISKVIQESCLFDSTYYLSRYEDIKRRNNDPLRHYIRHGYKENRNPNPFFDNKFYKEKHLKNKEGINPLYHYLTEPSANEYKISESFDGSFYLKNNPDVRKSGMNPLVHFLCHGIYEGRKGTKIEKESTLEAHIPSLSKDVSSIKVTIVIPVYNAIEEVKNCLDSLIRNTNIGHNIEVLVLNDCSPDKMVKPELNKYKDVLGIRVKHNFRNLGYTKNVNKGVKLAKGRDVVLLNSDTMVTPNWIRNLMSAAYQDDKVGTVTAVSNNSGAFSVPKSGTNDIPVNISVDSLSRIVSHTNGGYVDVPTGNGFCLYIKRELLDSIGGFDEEKFPMGYGEENEFCMRAVESGWSNIVDTKTYIYHKRSASFKESKYKLMEDGLKQVIASFPEYEGSIKAIGASEKFKNTRVNISKELERSSNISNISKPKIMFVISTRSGGTPQTNWDLMRNLRDVYDCYALASNSGLVEILRAGNDGYEVVEQFTLKEKVKYSSHRSREYEKLVKYLIYKYNIELLHIRHICWHSIQLPQLAKELLIPVVNSFHDFYAICPTVNLIDSQGVHHVEGVAEDAPNPLWRDETVKPMSKEMLKRWQNRMDDKLSVCDKYITTCNSAKEILLSKLPKIREKKSFDVISHGRDFHEFTVPKFRCEDNIEQLKVLVPGNITQSKGADLIKEIKSLDKDNIIDFHVVGVCQEDLVPFVTNHGKYNREEFQSLVAKINPHVSAVFSIWPETYCHTLTESWASGLPVIGLSYGAVEERIRKHKGGWLVSNDAAECFNLLKSIRTDHQDFNSKAESVKYWQDYYGKENTVSKMTGRYIEIYQDLIKPKILSAGTSKKLGFVMKGNFPDLPPTAYVRLVDWTDYFEEQTGKKVEYFHWSSILTADIGKFDELVIQRDAIPSYAVDWCLKALELNNIPYTFEIDDNLLDVPAISDPSGDYKSYRPYLERLIRSAKLVHVTNSDLASTIGYLNPNIYIRPNEVRRCRWENSNVDTVKLDVNEGIINILYFGSRTHQEDLDFAISVVEEINREKEVAHLYVIGCGDFEENKSITRLTPESSRYDLFIEWIKSISGNFDIGIAPLIDLEFSKNKSYLKCLEYDALGLNIICSNIKPYTELDLNQIKVSIEYADNNVNEWMNKIVNNFKGDVINDEE